MPEHAGGLGYGDEDMVLYKDDPEAKVCQACKGIITEVEIYCPRCIAQRRVIILLNSEKELRCERCKFHCLKNSYIHYAAMASRNVCNCKEKASDDTCLRVTAITNFSNSATAHEGENDGRSETG
jgi:hypothetical protein